MTIYTPTIGLKGLADRMHGRHTMIHDMTAAVIAGQFAGLVMAAVMMLVFGIFLGESPLFPVQLIGSVVFGEPSLVGLHIPALMTGLVLHQLGPSLFWALAFGLCVHGFKVEGAARQVLLGLAIGCVSQVVDAGILVPLAFQATQGADLWAREVPAEWSWAAHIVYGLCLGIYPILDERLSRT